VKRIKSNWYLNQIHLGKWLLIFVTITSISIALFSVFKNDKMEDTHRCFEVQDISFDQGYELILLKRIEQEIVPYTVCTQIFEIFQMFDKDRQDEFYILSKSVSRKDLIDQHQKCWDRTNKDEFTGPSSNIRTQSSYIIRNCPDSEYAEITRGKIGKKFIIGNLLPAYYHDYDHSLDAYPPESYFAISFSVGVFKSNIQAIMPVCHYLGSAEKDLSSNDLMSPEQFRRLYIEGCLTRFALEV